MSLDRGYGAVERGGQSHGFDSDREQALVERVRQRDVRAFEELYQRLYPRLSRFLANMLRRPTLVDEVLNDTMMVVWERLDGFNGESKVSTWVFAIAYRKAIRARGRADDPVEDRIETADATADGDPEGNAERAHAGRALRRALDGLSPDHRTVVELTYFHDLGYREIAEIMACPVDTVKTRMFHARRHLKTLLIGDRSDWL